MMLWQVVGQPCVAARSLTYPIRQHVRPEVPQRQLELLQAVVDRDLDGDECVLRDGVGAALGWGSHGGGRVWHVVEVSGVGRGSSQQAPAAGAVT